MFLKNNNAKIQFFIIFIYSDIWIRLFYIFFEMCDLNRIYTEYWSFDLIPMSYVVFLETNHVNNVLERCGTVLESKIVINNRKIDRLWQTDRLMSNTLILFSWIWYCYYCPEQLATIPNSWLLSRTVDYYPQNHYSEEKQTNHTP